MWTSVLYITIIKLSIFPFYDNNFSVIIDTMKLSVVIPAYNESEYIASCLDSFMKQEVQADEIIIVNNMMGNIFFIKIPFVFFCHSFLKR